MEFPVMLDVRSGKQINLSMCIKNGDVKSLKRVFSDAMSIKDLRPLMNKYILICGEHIECCIPHMMHCHQEVKIDFFCWELDLAWDWLNGVELSEKDIVIAKNTLAVSFNLLWWTFVYPMGETDVSVFRPILDRKYSLSYAIEKRFTLLRKLLATGQIDRSDV